MKRFAAGRSGAGALCLVMSLAAYSPTTTTPPPPLGQALSQALLPPDRTVHAARAGAGELTYTGELMQGGWVRGTAPRGTAALTLDGSPVEVDADGAFLVAFDRDAPPRAILTARLADGTAVSRALAVAPRSWRIEHVDAARSPEGPTEQFLATRRGELAQIEAARLRHTGAQGWRQRFQWPATGRISGLFGSQRIYRGEPAAYHSGLDIALPSGTVFVAPADGVVVLAAASPFTLEGRLLLIDHGHGLNSAFLHCSQLLVTAGQTVKQGEPIGRVGMTGRATGPHLHWSIKWRDARLDPLLFTGPMASGKPLS